MSNFRLWQLTSAKIGRFAVINYRFDLSRCHLKCRFFRISKYFLFYSVDLWILHVAGKNCGLNPKHVVWFHFQYSRKSWVTWQKLNLRQHRSKFEHFRHDTFCANFCCLGMSQWWSWNVNVSCINVEQSIDIRDKWLARLQQVVMSFTFVFS